ncbi:hypothetical protein D3C81_1848000 [compost metagenome]
MREYKFRAKAIEEMADGDQLVYGFGVHVVELVNGEKEYVLHTENGTYQVDPKTVGQYTGDKNRGYEGDILGWVEPIRGEHGDIEDWEHCRGVVEWDNERSGFIVRCANGNEWLDALMNTTVIGNRWDNPNLLGG